MHLIGFGEAMVRYAPQADAPEQADPNAQVMLRSIGGDELNVCVAMARLNSSSHPVQSEWVSVLPTGPLGDLVFKSGEMAGVEQDHVLRVVDADVGTFTVIPEMKAVHYQRRNSAFAQHNASDFDWNKILTKHENTWLHMTGITPMITDKTRVSWEAAMTAALANNVPCSVDFNHRPQLGSIIQLWEIMKPFVDKLEVLIMSVASLQKLAQEVFEEELVFPPAEVSYQDDAWVDFLCKFKLVTNARRVAVCFKARDENGVQQRWSAIVDDNGYHTTEELPVFHVPKDECGGGSAWAAGLLHWIAEHGLKCLSSSPPTSSLEKNTSSSLVLAARRADILAALCQETAGDHSQVRLDELVEVETAFADSPAHLETSTTNASNVIEKTFLDLKEAGVVAILRSKHPDAAIARGIELCEMGCKAIEVTLDTVDWRRVLQEIVKSVPASVVVGVGTVMDDDVKVIKDLPKLGARFALSPIEPIGFIDECHKHGILAVPAGMTSNELWDMHRRGARVLKMFHASIIGPKILKSMLGVSPLMALNILPSGGCDPSNFKEWLKAGAFCVGMGSNLTGRDIKSIPGSQDYESGRKDWDERGRGVAQTLFKELKTFNNQQKQ
eukprot:m.19585 g.19585  ORF g.19585 m.19585 type:complete len:612 (-) comp8487_c0_seq1:92-1927(-)